MHKITKSLAVANNTSTKMPFVGASAQPHHLEEPSSVVVCALAEAAEAAAPLSLLDSFRCSSASY